MNIFKNIFNTSESSIEDKVLKLIEKNYSPFTSAFKSKATDTEGKILLLSTVYEYLIKKEGVNSFTFNTILNKFVASLDGVIVSSIVASSSKTVKDFIIERCKMYQFFHKYLILTASNGGVPSGTCYCLYIKPLGKYEYFQCLKNDNNEYEEVSLDTNAFLNYASQGRAILSAEEEYIVRDFRIFEYFVTSYFAAERNFKTELFKLFN